jgi:FkbM family methyltransferase
VDWLSRTFTPQSVLYDVGANVGAYALVAASVTCGAGTVYAFEPGSETYASLVENIRANGHTGAITPFPVALGATTGVVRFAYSSLEAGAARHPGIQPEFAGAGAAVSTVLCYRLDDFIREFGLKAPTHFKIDVDGAELAVLDGAPEALRRPGLRWILVEVEVGDAANVLRHRLEESGFVLLGDYPHYGQVHNWVFGRDAG